MQPRAQGGKATNDVQQHQQPARKRKSTKSNADLTLPLGDDAFADDLAFLDPISGDHNLSLTGDKNSSSKANYAAEHDTFLQLDFGNDAMHDQLGIADAVRARGKFRNFTPPSCCV
jgi:hypothetical protein